jgi:uncharacterized membrane protein YphA (DoxX/SURF4 family)
MALGRPTAVSLAAVVARFLLGGILVLAGALKVGRPSASARAVQAYQLLPFDVAAYVGYALPTIEIVVGLLLLLGLFTRFSAVIGGALMLAYIIGIAAAWARGLSIDCGCFGGGGTIAAGQARYLGELLRDAGLLACAAWLAARPASPLSLDRLWLS